MWNLGRLGREPNNTARSMARCIWQALRRNLTQEEAAWIDRIEQVRAYTNASTDQIIRKDYGAGDDTSKRTPAEMQAGIEIADTVGNFSERASKSRFWGMLLFKLVRTMHPVSCVELGTAAGISAAYQAAALRLNGRGSLITLEGAASLAHVAERNFRQLDLDNVNVSVGRFADTLPGVLKARGPIDYVFIDGHHEEEAALTYFQQILPNLEDIALVVFDDIKWSDGMKRAWTSIADHPKVSIALDLGSAGVCIFDTSIKRSRYFSIPLLGANAR